MIMITSFMRFWFDFRYRDMSLNLDQPTITNHLKLFGPKPKFG